MARRSIRWARSRSATSSTTTTATCRWRSWAAHRAPYHDPDVFGGTEEERSEAISSYLSYSGPFEVLADRDTVIHHIEISSFPNWIGNAQVRFAELDGDLLTLSTKPMTFQGVERTAKLVWERVGRD